MKLAKAIEILSDIIILEHSAKKTDKDDAINLGLQAIQRINLARSYGDIHTLQRLPGED